MKNDHRVLKNKSLQIWDHKPIVRLTFLGQGWRYDVLLFEKLFFSPNLILELIFSFGKHIQRIKEQTLVRKNHIIWFWSETYEWTQQSATDTKTYRNYFSFDKKIFKCTRDCRANSEFRKNKQIKKWSPTVWDRVPDRVRDVGTGSGTRSQDFFCHNNLLSFVF